MRPDQVIRSSASTRHGLASVADYYAAGGSRDALRRLLERGEWERRSAKVLRVIGAPVTERQDALAAVLDAAPGAVLSHDSAAALWTVPGFDLLPAHITQHQPKASKRNPTLAVGHWAAKLSDEFTTVLDAIPVVTPSFLALQLFATLHPDRARRAVSKLLMLHLVNLRSLSRVLEVEAVQGRNGIMLLRQFVEEDVPRSRPAESGLELRFEEILVRAGEEPMRRQIHVGGSQPLGRIDEVDQHLPFIVQLDSAMFHGALVDQEDDERQRQALEAAGYTVRRITDEQCFHHPDDVVRMVRDVRAALRRRHVA